MASGVSWQQAWPTASWAQPGEQANRLIILLHSALTRLILNNKSSFEVFPIYKKDINDHNQIQQRATMMAGAGALGEETV